MARASSPRGDSVVVIGLGRFGGAVADFAGRYAAAAASTDELTAEERRARSGLLSRQVTLR